MYYYTVPNLMLAFALVYVLCEYFYVLYVAYTIWGNGQIEARYEIK